MDRSRLEEQLKNNVLIITFARRTPPKGAFRRMLCTKSSVILNSTLASLSLNFRNPKHGGPKFDERAVNVIVVWDILKQDYRLVPCESARIEQVIEPDEFWEFFKNNVTTMTTRQAESFMYAK